MLGSSADANYGQLMTQPDQVGGVETQTCYLVVEDAETCYAQAKAAGADILLDIRNDDDGGRCFTCRDPEGHIWNFGTYAPVKQQLVADMVVPAAARPRPRQTNLAAVVGTVICTAIVSAALTGWLYHSASVARVEAKSVDEANASPITAQSRDGTALQQERSAREAAEQSATLSKALLVQEQARRQAFEQATRDALTEAARERSAREAAETAVRDAQSRIEKEQSALQAAELGVTTANDLLVQERSKRAAAENAASEADALARRERVAREAAEAQIEIISAKLALISETTTPGNCALKTGPTMPAPQLRSSPTGNAGSDTERDFRLRQRF